MRILSDHDLGFTFIELLVILVIIGIVFVSVVPMFGERIGRGNPQAAFFKDLLKEHADYAKEMGVPAAILGFKGSANIEKYDGTRTAIPEIKSVQSVRINTRETSGINYTITVYPDGICDYFEIETDKGVVIESRPLLLSVVFKKAASL